jgi:uncharacterized protein YodC (DUF2158 family)
MNRLIDNVMKRYTLGDVKIGDVVRLRSGGPDMTVISKRDHEEFVCGWFTSNETGAYFDYSTAPFVSSTLVIIETRHPLDDAFVGTQPVTD